MQLKTRHHLSENSTNINSSKINDLETTPELKKALHRIEEIKDSSAQDSAKAKPRTQLFHLEEDHTTQEEEEMKGYTNESRPQNLKDLVTKVDEGSVFPPPGQEFDTESNSEVATQPNKESFTDIHKTHMIQTLQALLFIKTLKPVPPQVLAAKSIDLPPPKKPFIKKTLIFDLDETLVHCIEDFENENVDHVISISFPTGEVIEAGINIRPYAYDCLQKANEDFQVVVFTASHKSYADAVLDFLDPSGALIQTRLYRDHCIETDQGVFIKDLRVIRNRDLKDVILVDNAAYSFGYQLDNGVPIIPFYKDKADKELLHLTQYLSCVLQAEDVRDQNQKAFQLGELGENEIVEYLNLYVSMDNNQAVQEEDQLEEDEDDDEESQEQQIIAANDIIYEDGQENMAYTDGETGSEGIDRSVQKLGASK